MGTSHFGLICIKNMAAGSHLVFQFFSALARGRSISPIIMKFVMAVDIYMLMEMSHFGQAPPTNRATVGHLGFQC